MQEKTSAFEQKSNHRFELAEKFVKDSKQAKIIASKENPEGIRDFLKKIGSNFHIAERTLAVDLKKPWRVAQKWHLAERAGFEPAVPFQGHRFSRAAPSTTQTPLHRQLV